MRDSWRSLIGTDLHQPRAQRSRPELPAPEAYYHHTVDFERLRRDVLEPIRRTGSLERELILLDLASDTWTLSRDYQVTPKSIVLVEGVFLLREELDGLLDLVVVLHVDDDDDVGELARSPSGQVDTLRGRASGIRSANGGRGRRGRGAERSRRHGGLLRG